MMTWHWLLERGHHIHLCVISQWFLYCQEPISILTTPMINAPPQSPESPDYYHGYFSAHVFLDLHVALCILGLLESVSLFWEHAVSPASSSLFSLPHLCALHLLAPRASVVPWSSFLSLPLILYLCLLLVHYSLLFLSPVCRGCPSLSLHLNLSSGHLLTICLSLYFHYLNWSISLWDNFLSKGHVAMSRDIFDCYNLWRGPGNESLSILQYMR